MKINYGDKRWASAFLDGEGCIKYYRRLKANREVRFISLLLLE